MPHPPAQRLTGAALPAALRDLPGPPDPLFVHGPLPRGPRVAIVGTRTPTARAREYAAWLAARLAEQGVAILSGGAEGIDAAAHQGALEVGGVTVVVGPSSFDRPFPAQHADLFARIVASGGAYVSVFEHGVEPRRHQFFRRNSVLVALAQVLVVVEAPLRSGALNAAGWARRLARPCFVVPSPPWNSQGLGCIAELRRGARPLGSPKDVLRWLGEHELHSVPLRPPVPPASEWPQGAGEPRPAARARQPARAARAAATGATSPSATGDPVLDAMLSAIRAGHRHPDEIGRAVSLGAAAVSHGLLRLTLEGQIVQDAAGDIRLAGQ